MSRIGGRSGSRGGPSLGMLRLGVAVVASAAFSGCEDTRPNDGVLPYVGRVQTLLTTACASCHSGASPAAGWRADSYLGVIGCMADGAPATVGAGAAPIVRALARPDHATLLGASDRALLTEWVTDGASLGGGGVHDRSFADPRSPSSHGAFLRARAYAPMLDASDPDACGACHDGPPRRAGIAIGAIGAPACATCHTEPEGALGCGTCHGSGSRAYPPRDRCFFPGDKDDRTHAAHVAPSPMRAAGFACSTCHPTPRPGQIGGVHANGHVEVWFDYAVAGREARIDPSTGACTGTCHARGGARPSPAWGDGAMTCNDCHSSPPPGHYRGACTSCHREANADGTALTAPTLHLNGKVDLGDGSGRCGACHGVGDDPWPTTGAHPAHASPTSSRPVACETCHAVPGGGDAHPLGLGSAAVRLSGLAIQGGRRATYDPTTKTCAGTYCHEGEGASRPAPRWTDGASASTCGACHSAPPPPPHAQSATCSAATCHEGSTSGMALTPKGRLYHVDGQVTRGLP